ncbi:MAG TPA: hypothetical protein VF814_18940 [Casimicrobiaceae bacterium]
MRNAVGNGFAASSANRCGKNPSVQRSIGCGKMWPALRLGRKMMFLH